MVLVMASVSCPVRKEGEDDGESEQEEEEEETRRTRRREDGKICRRIEAKTIQWVRVRVRVWRRVWMRE